MKKKQSFHYTTFVCLLIAVLLSACTGKPAPINCATRTDFCVGLVTEVGRINDHGLNEMTWEGVKKAEEKLGAHIQYIETVDSRDYEKNIATFANAKYDLIITVGYDQSEATLAAANKYSELNFLGVDQPLGPDKSLPRNLTGLSFAEDQMGFLAGVLATKMTKLNKVGAVCGPDFLGSAWRYCEGFKAGVQYINSPPTPEPEATETETPTPEPAGPKILATQTPRDEAGLKAPSLQGSTRKQFALQARQEVTPTETATPAAPTSNETPASGETPAPTETATPTVEAIVVYHNEIGFKDSVVDPEWDATTADKLIVDNGVDVIFGADSYSDDENGAVRAAAKRRVYAIGVNTDQYLTMPDAQYMLISSVVKQVELNVFNLIKATRYNNFPGGDFIGTVGYAPYHDLSDHVTTKMAKELLEIQNGLADGSIKTDVLWRKP